MKALSPRFHYLFGSTNGLVLVAIGMIALVTAFFGMISGPMAEFGIRDAVIQATGMDLVDSEREGRIIMLYHAIAMAVVAIEVYFITGILPMKKHQVSMINATVTVGYLCSMIFGLWFAYFGHNFVVHGVFIFGNSLMFFGDAIDNGRAQTGPTIEARSKWTEEILDLGRRHPPAGILKPHCHRTVLGGAGTYRQAPSLGHGAQSVAGKVPEHLLDLIHINSARQGRDRE